MHRIIEIVQFFAWNAVTINALTAPQKAFSKSGNFRYKMDLYQIVKETCCGKTFYRNMFLDFGFGVLGLGSGY